MKHSTHTTGAAGRRFALLTAVFLCMSAVSGCSGTKTVETAPQTTQDTQTLAPSEAETTTAAAGLPNPMQEVSDSLDFEKLGIHMIAPAEAENVQYFIINGEVADIHFTLDGVDYTWRASNTAEDFAGIFERFKTDEGLLTTFELNGATTEISIKTTESGGRLAMWEWGDTKYTLYTASQLDDGAIEALALKLAELSLSENQ